MDDRAARDAEYQVLIRARHSRLCERWREGGRVKVGGEEIAFDLVLLGLLGMCVETELRPRWREGDVRILGYPDVPAGYWWRD